MNPKEKLQQKCKKKRWWRDCMTLNSRRSQYTHLDFLWPSSTSPSTSETSLMKTSSPSLSPGMMIEVNSRSNHSFAHRVRFLFFQCQLAVEYAIGAGAVADMVVTVTPQLWKQKIIGLNNQIRGKVWPAERVSQNIFWSGSDMRVSTMFYNFLVFQQQQVLHLSSRCRILTQSSTTGQQSMCTSRIPQSLRQMDFFCFARLIACLLRLGSEGQLFLTKRISTFRFPKISW